MLINGCRTPEMSKMHADESSDLRVVAKILRDVFGVSHLAKIATSLHIVNFRLFKQYLAISHRDQCKIGIWKPTLIRVAKSLLKRKNFLLHICELHSSIYLQRVILCTSIPGTCIEHSSCISAGSAEFSRYPFSIIPEIHLLGQA